MSETICGPFSALDAAPIHCQLAEEFDRTTGHVSEKALFVRTPIKANRRHVVNTTQKIMLLLLALATCGPKGQRLRGT